MFETVLSRLGLRDDVVLVSDEEVIQVTPALVLCIGVETGAFHKFSNLSNL